MNKSIKIIMYMILIQLIVYLGISFITWDTKWFITIGTWDLIGRLLALGLWLCITVYSYLTLHHEIKSR